MDLHLFENKFDMGRAAAERAASLLVRAIASEGEANLVLATGNSQIEMLSALVGRLVDWSRVTVFHLDEYLGIPDIHPASFRRYLKEKFVERVGELRAFHGVNGEGDPAEECARLKEIISGLAIHVACVGIGENGHLAFNDPPADFDTEEPYIIVELDEVCRSQQVGEGWFASLTAVPTRAITMSIRQIMKAKSIICTVPDLRKAEALRNSVEGEVTNLVPASILQRHADCHVFGDGESGSLLRGTV